MARAKAFAFSGCVLSATANALIIAEPITTPLATFPAASKWARVEIYIVSNDYSAMDQQQKWLAFFFSKVGYTKSYSKRKLCNSPYSVNENWKMWRKFCTLACNTIETAKTTLAERFHGISLSHTWHNKQKNPQGQSIFWFWRRR